MNPITVGRNIAKYRKVKELTQTMLADGLGVSNKTVSKWECGRGLPDKSMFISIQELLCITREQLFEETELVSQANDLPRNSLLSLIFLVFSGIVLISVTVFLIIGYATRVPAKYYTLTIKGAEFLDKSQTVSLSPNAILPKVKLSQVKNFLGWADSDNKFYDSESFVMAERDMTLSAIYEQDLGDMFTPSCAYEEIVSGSSYEAEHINFGPYKATKYEIEGYLPANTGYKILNGTSMHNDFCNNNCPISKERASIVVLTLVNNGKQEISIEYSVDYYRIIGSVKATIAAGAQVKVPLYYSKSPQGFLGDVTAFHRLNFVNAVESGFSITIYGQHFNPDYYEQASMYDLSFSGATFNDMENFELLFNAMLPSGEIKRSDSLKTFVGWKTSRGKVFVSDEELLQYYRMPLSDDTISAVYKEDLNLFTPSCVYKDVSKSDENKRLGTHNPDGSTSYILESNIESWLIYNGVDEKHQVENNCPISYFEQRLYRMTFQNDSDMDITIEVGPEYRRIVDSFKLTIPRKSVISVSMRIYGREMAKSFWQINNKSQVSPAQKINLTILGYYT